MPTTKPRTLFLSCVLLALSIPAATAQDKAHLSIDASKGGAKIDRNLLGQFAENLGRGLYGGIWVGPDSPIPNTRGIRNDVVAALRELNVPNVRWPGGCFADQTFVPVAFDAGNYTHDGVTLPRLDAIAAKDASGKLWLAVTNLDPEKSLQVEADITGIKATNSSGEKLTAPAVDSVNTFDSARSVVPMPAAVKLQSGKLELSLGPKSVTVVSIGP